MPSEPWEEREEFADSSFEEEYPEYELIEQHDSETSDEMEEPEYEYSEEEDTANYEDDGEWDTAEAEYQSEEDVAWSADVEEWSDSDPTNSSYEQEEQPMSKENSIFDDIPNEEPEALKPYFDYYYTWLGIPPEEQPPHHYRLLGLKLFEDNPDVVETAVNLRMQYLQSLTHGDHIEEAQELLNELSRVRLVLLMPDEKEAYDQQLATEIGPDYEVVEEEEEEIPLPPGMQNFFNEMQVQERNRKKGRPRQSASLNQSAVFRKRKGNRGDETSEETTPRFSKQQKILYGSIAGGVLLLGLMLIYFFGGGSKADEDNPDNRIKPLIPSQAEIEDHLRSFMNEVAVENLYETSPIDRGLLCEHFYTIAKKVKDPHKKYAALQLMIQFALEAKSIDPLVTAFKEVRKSYKPNQPDEIFKMEAKAYTQIAPHLNEVFAKSILLDQAKPVLEELEVLYALKEALILADAINQIIQNEQAWIKGEWQTIHQRLQQAYANAISNSGLLKDQQNETRFVRLTELTPSITKVGWDSYRINRPPENDWPQLDRETKPCKEYLYCHAPASLTYEIPEGAKFFTTVGYRVGGPDVDFRITMRDEKPDENVIEVPTRDAFEGGFQGGFQVNGEDGEFDAETLASASDARVVPFQIKLPDEAKTITLSVGNSGSAKNDHVFWLKPRFHFIEKDDFLRNKAQSKSRRYVKLTTMKPVEVKEEEKYWNFRINGTRTGWKPQDVTEWKESNEIIYAHANSHAYYEIPEGATEFSAFGWAVKGGVEFRVYADETLLFRSGKAGIVPIRVSIPEDSQTLIIRIDNLGNGFADHSMWCYPRFYGTMRDGVPFYEDGPNAPEAISREMTIGLAASYKLDEGSEEEFKMPPEWKHLNVKNLHGTDVYKNFLEELDEGNNLQNRTREGRFYLNGTLTYYSGTQAVLGLMNEPPTEYLLQIRAARLKDQDNTMGVGLPVGNHRVYMIANYRGHRIGLESVQGKWVSDHPFRSDDPHFTTGEPLDILIHVSSESVQIWLDRTQAVNWRGDSRDLTPPSHHKHGDSDLLFLKFEGGNYETSRLELIDLTKVKWE